MGCWQGMYWVKIDIRSFQSQCFIASCFRIKKTDAQSERLRVSILSLQRIRPDHRTILFVAPFTWIGVITRCCPYFLQETCLFSYPDKPVFHAAKCLFHFYLQAGWTLLTASDRSLSGIRKYVCCRRDRQIRGCRYGHQSNNRVLFCKKDNKSYPDNLRLPVLFRYLIIVLLLFHPCFHSMHYSG